MKASVSPPTPDEAEDAGGDAEGDAGGKRRKYTEVEERLMLELMGRMKFKARFVNRTEKKDKVWKALADAFNDEMQRHYRSYSKRDCLLLRNKWDHLLRGARKHHLFVQRNNGTLRG